MIIERISFKDFGIFRDQLMEDLHPGLVVIWGPNRAGKTTFMKALRYLGFGIPKSDSIPQASGTQHELCADVRLEDGSRYQIQLVGHSKPKISPLDNSKDISVEEIFGNLEGYTYRQVFTISLDELRRLPEETPASQEHQLQTVLLGGGWTDALKLTQIKEEFRKQAALLGGKKGSKNVGEFRSYSDRIKEGLLLRDTANNQLEEYHAAQSQLVDLTKTLNDLQEDLSRKEEELAVYELLRDNYETYAQMTAYEDNLYLPENRKLLAEFPSDGVSRGESLLKDYEQVRREYDFLKTQFDTAAGLHRLETLLERGETLTAWEKQLSGWRQRTNTLIKNIKEHEDNEAKLRIRLQQVNASWDGDLSLLDNIRLDRINEDNLGAQLRTYEELRNMVSEYTRQIEYIRLKLENKEKETQEIPGEKSRRPEILWISILGLAAVMVSGVFFDTLIALAAGIVTAAGMVASLIVNNRKAKHPEKEYLQSEVKNLNQELDILELQRQNAERNLQASAQALESAIKETGLPPELSFTSLPGFIKEIRFLKERYGEWLAQEEQLQNQIDQEKKLALDLAALLEDLEIGTLKSTDSLHSLSGLYDDLEMACGWLKDARQLETYHKTIKDIEKNILQLLQEENPSAGEQLPATSQATKQALEDFLTRGRRYAALKEEEQAYSDLQKSLIRILSTEKNQRLLKMSNIPVTEDSLLSKAFAELCQQWACHSAAQAEENRAKATSGIDELKKEIEDLKEKKVSLELRLSQLASDEKLHQANRIITEARQNLERRAEEYAVLRLAGEIVANSYESLLEKTKGAVLNKAGDFFSKITSGEYTAITLGETSQHRDFQAVPRSGGKEMETKYLSRATREQLFLSVRLSRIKNIHPPLPVVLDDTMVNFDPAHGQKTVSVIAQLAETHQVFVLSCHPQMLEWIASTGCTAQYWNLEKGKFSLCRG